MDFDLERLSEADLIDLNRRIIARIEFLRASSNYAAMLQFRIGDRVMFETSEGEPVVGTLIRFNRKTVTVLTDRRERWTITPTLLQKAVAFDAADDVSNVLPFDRREREEG